MVLPWVLPYDWMKLLVQWMELLGMHWMQLLVEAQVHWLEMLLALVQVPLGSSWLWWA